MSVLPPLPTRRWMLTALMAGVAAPGCAEAPARSIRPATRSSAGAAPAATAKGTQCPGLGAMVEAARLGGKTSLMLLDAQSGRVLEALNEGAALPPASTLKALTALYALDRLGPAHRWTTRLLGTGTVGGGTLNGDLILLGGGDPTLSADGLGDLAAALAARGVKRISGRFLVSGAALPHVDRIDPEQPEYVGYNPTLSGMILNHNRVYCEWRRAGQGWSFAMDARAERFVPAVSMASVRAVNRDAPLFAYAQGDGMDRWTVSAAALGNGGSRWLPVRQPELYAGDVFRTLARAQGITLPAPTVTTAAPGGTALAQVSSDGLIPVMRDCLKYSTNITAEAVGIASSGASSLPASAARMADWARGRYGIGARLVDHSGLGGSARMAAADMAQALLRGRGSGLPAMLREHGLRDAKGKQVQGSPVRVPAKTGTLNFASGLAGYIQPPGGREMVFAIFSADVDRRSALSRAEREQPSGGPQWTSRARGLQNALVARWVGRFA